MKILVTNDDGVDAVGIRALAAALQSVNGTKVIMVAPDREQSTTSHSLTLHRPLRIIKNAPDVYAVDGTPTDCVYMAVSVVFKEKPDIIFSGINRGGNLGDDIHYSGTVSAAVEGGIMGIPSVAMSQLVCDEFDCTTAARFAKKILRFLKKNTLPKGVILNVNIPAGAKKLDYAVTATGKCNYGEPIVEKIDPRGRPYYWVGGNEYKFYDIKGSDCNAIVAGKISVTPLQVNTTSWSYIKDLHKIKI